MSWTFILALIISAISIIIASVTLRYEVAHNGGGQITPSQKSRRNLILGYAGWIGVCLLLYQINLHALGSILPWISNIPAVLFTLFVLVITFWGPKDFK